MTDPTVTVDDMRALRLCMGGGRRMAASHGLSWDHFVTYGYPASTLEACNEPLLNRLAEQARARARLENVNG